LPLVYSSPLLVDESEFVPWQVMSTSDPLVPRLLGRGGVVSITEGKLAIDSPSGAPVPDDYLEEYGDRIIAEILERMGLEWLRYESHTVDRFSFEGKKIPGVLLQFISMTTDARPFAIFNAILDRDRNITMGDELLLAGSPLPPGQFRITENYDFLRLWKEAGLTVPLRLSSFPDRMGKLKGIEFIGHYQNGEKLANKSIHPFSLSHIQILEAFELVLQSSNSQKTAGQVPDDHQTSTGQSPDNHRTATPDKETLADHTQQGFQANPATRAISRGNTLIRKEGNKGTRAVDPKIYDDLLEPYDDLKDQSIDEWLERFESVPVPRRKLVDVVDNDSDGEREVFSF
jgi:hypothetical protein